MKLIKPYPFLKAAVSSTALILALLHERSAALIIAYLFCICGDLFLAWSGELGREQKEPFFTIGIAAFGAAHIFLIFYFGLHLRAVVIAAVLIFLLWLAGKSGFIVPGKYRMRVSVYSIAVSLMLASAAGTDYFPAALLFWISDGLLAVWYFHSGTPLWLGGLALILYYSSLFLLA